MVLRHDHLRRPGERKGVKIYIDGAAQDVNVAADTLKNSIRTEVPFKLAQRNTGARLDNLALQDLRIYGRVLSPEEVAALASVTRAAYLVALPAEGRTSAETEELYGWWLGKVDTVSAELAAHKRTLEETEAAIKSRATVAHVMQEKQDPAMAFVLYRGEYDKRRDEVHPDTPAALPPFPDDLPRNRLGWPSGCCAPEHPLTARVTVNRFWQEVFGTGLVQTSGDFGVAGRLPSHPELLDWLAVEFRETGWDIKRFFRMMVLSSTYRQSAAITPEKLDKDRDNRLLSRGPRFRMDAEMVRDYALAASGLLVPTIGGPSVHPYQPEGVWEAVAMIGSNTRNYKAGRRREPVPPQPVHVLEAGRSAGFDGDFQRPESRNLHGAARADQYAAAGLGHAERSAVRRSRPAAGGPRLAEGGEADAARLDFITQRLLARKLSDEERSIAGQSLATLLGYYREHPDDAKKLIATGASKPNESLDAATLAAWTMITNELMNLDEVVNK